MTDDQVETVFLTFNRCVPERPRKTEIWEVYGKRNKIKLGVISWYPQWRQYVFHPEPNTLFNRTCLGDIQWFCALLISAHAQQLREAKTTNDPKFH